MVHGSPVVIDLHGVRGGGFGVPGPGRGIRRDAEQSEQLVDSCFVSENFTKSVFFTEKWDPLRIKVVYVGSARLDAASLTFFKLTQPRP